LSVGLKERCAIKTCGAVAMGGLEQPVPRVRRFSPKERGSNSLSIGGHETRWSPQAVWTLRRKDVSLTAARDTR
jgi:hypothetical protein